VKPALKAQHWLVRLDPLAVPALLEFREPSEIPALRAAPRLAQSVPPDPRVKLAPKAKLDRSVPRDLPV
jgi:hypothetical protein